MYRLRGRPCLSASLLFFCVTYCVVQMLTAAMRHGTPLGFLISPKALRSESGLYFKSCELKETLSGSSLRGRFCLSESSARVSCVLRRGILESGLLSAAVVYIFNRPVNRPKSAPGPSNELVEREQEAKQKSEEAQEAVDVTINDPIAQKKLEEAMRRLSEVEEQIRTAEADLQAYPIPPYLINSCQRGTVNICVTGASGVGKSSWINAIRRLAPRDPGAALTGVTETTTDPQGYLFPRPGDTVRNTAAQDASDGHSKKQEEEDNDDAIRLGDRLLLQNCDEEELNEQIAEVIAYGEGDASWEVQLSSGRRLVVGKHQVTGVLADCVIWDLPGVGTPNFPQNTYLKNMGIRHFDMVVLMTATRFTEAELLLLQELRKWRVPFFLVRNKIDADMQVEIEAEEEEEGDLDHTQRRSIELRAIDKIKSFFKSDFGLTDVYCISTRRKLRDDYDFRKLERDMEIVLNQQRMVK